MRGQYETKHEIQYKRKRKIENDEIATKMLYLIIEFISTILFYGVIRSDFFLFCIEPFRTPVRCKKCKCASICYQTQEDVKLAD